MIYHRNRAAKYHTYARWILLSFDHLRNVLPLYQNKIPNKHHSSVRPIFVIIGGIYPDSMIHGVTNLLNPYPQRFLLMVMETKIPPVTGLYESTAYVETIAGRPAT